MEQQPTRIGRYAVEEELGRGRWVTGVPPPMCGGGVALVSEFAKIYPK